MGLEYVDGSVFSLFDMNAKVILNFSFIHQLVSFFELVDDDIYGAIFLCNYYVIMYMDHKDGVYFFVYTIIYCGLCESYVHDAFVEVSIPYSTSLFLAIQVIVEEEDVCLCIFFIQNCAWG